MALPLYNTGTPVTDELALLEKIGFDFESVDKVTCGSWMADGSLTYDIRGFYRFENVKILDLHQIYIEDISPLSRTYKLNVS